MINLALVLSWIKYLCVWSNLAALNIDYVIAVYLNQSTRRLFSLFLIIINCHQLRDMTSVGPNSDAYWNRKGLSFGLSAFYDINILLYWNFGKWRIRHLFLLVHTAARWLLVYIGILSIKFLRFLRTVTVCHLRRITALY